MARLRVDDLGKLGLNSDIQSTLLPINAWTRLENCITEDNSIRAAIGMAKLFNLHIKPLYHTSYMVPEGIQYIIVSNGIKVYAYNLQSVVYDITPTGDLHNGYITFTILNGILVANSLSDGPFYWGGSLTTKLVPLPGWDINWRCTSMIAYRYYLVALGMIETGIGFPHKVRWSNSAAEGELPTLWIAATSNDAGADLIGETPGAIVGGALIRDALWIVKEDAIYDMRWIGGEFIMQLSRLSGGMGTRLKNGFVPIRGSMAIFTSTDLLMFDGQSTSSIVDQRVRRALYQLMSEELWDNSVLFVHTESSRLLVAGINAGYTRLNGMLMYNWEEKTWSHQVLKNSYGFDSVLVAIEGGMLTWDQLGVARNYPGVKPLFLAGKTWDEQTDGSWNKGVYQPSVPDIVVYESDDTDTWYWVSIIGLTNTDSAGVPYTCIAERTGIPIEGADGLAMITEVWPELQGNIPVRISIGGMQTANSAPVWSPPIQVVPGITEVITPRVTGRFICVHVESAADGYWKLGSLTYNWQRAGMR